MTRLVALCLLLALPAYADEPRTPMRRGDVAQADGVLLSIPETQRVVRAHAACTAERDFLHRVLIDSPPSASEITETPSGYVVALAAGLAIGLTAGAYVTFRAMR